MRPVTSFGIKFQLRLSRKNGDMAPLQVRITVNGERKEISLEHRVKIENWLQKEEKLKGNDIDTKQLNSYINEVRSRLYEAKRVLILDSQEVNPQAIWNKFIGKTENEHTLKTIVQYHNDNMNHSLTWGTAKNYHTTQKYLNEFLKEKLKVTDIGLSQLNYKFLVDFEIFLRGHVPGENQKPCGNNTVMKHIERFRKIISMAIKNDWLKQDPFIKFKPTFIKKDRGFLTEEELAVIERKPIMNMSLKTVRDLFVFSCYTGLAYSDAFQLKKEDMFKGIDGEWWIIVQRQKTKIQAQIPLLPKALEIINMYKTHPKVLANQTLLPMLTNQRFNSYLKEIADICNINKNLTHHLARHTFATTVCLTNGVSMEATSSMLGHASTRTTQIYGKILPKRISAEMQVLKNKMANNKEFTINSIKEG